MRRDVAVRVAALVFAVAVAALTTALVVDRGAAAAAEVTRLRTAAEALAAGAAPLFAVPSAEADASIRRWAAASGLRVSLIRADGTVHADSWTLPELLGRLENHAGRPEVTAARSAGVGISERRSATTDDPTTYVAALVGPASSPVGFVRLAIVRSPRPLPWLALGVALAAALAAGTLAGARAARRHREVARHLTTWSDLPADGDLEALAEDADRHFRDQREALVREVEATRAAFAEVAEGVVLLDGRGLVRFANPAAVGLLGRQLEVGRTLVEAVRVPELVAAVGALAEGLGTQYTSVAVAGVELAVRACAVSHPVLTTAVVLRDVSGERQLERARRALVADLAHELRTPLTVLGGLVEELEETGQGSELSATLQRQVRRLQTFAEDLEELAAVEAGRLSLHPEEVDAATVIRQVLRDSERRATEAGVELAQEGGAVGLETDPVRLGQVIANVVDNAIRYNRRGGFVRVRSEATGTGCRIVVEDNGVGIPEAEIPLVFQRFYRVRRGPSAGSGLGLAIVKHLVRALGGTVQLASREGRGTVVTVELPPRFSAAERPSSR